MKTSKHELHLLDLSQCSILEQLRIEEALLRADSRNYCILNKKISPAIVMGISSNVDEMINMDRWQKKQVPVIRRFSGGGTVFIDENSLMVTFILNSEDVSVPCFPKAIFEWSDAFYSKVFKEIPFRLRENDYVVHDKKFGGNAQYMTKNRFLHHTSFLWDYNKSHMEYLKIPLKMPNYREKRDHDDFLCKLKDFYQDKKVLKNNFLNVLENTFSVKNVLLDNILAIKNIEHRKATTQLL